MPVTVTPVRCQWSDCGAAAQHSVTHDEHHDTPTLTCGRHLALVIDHVDSQGAFPKLPVVPSPTTLAPLTPADAAVLAAQAPPLDVGDTYPD